MLWGSFADEMTFWDGFSGVGENDFGWRTNQGGVCFRGATLFDG